MEMHLCVSKNPDNFMKREYEVIKTINIRLKKDVDVVSPIIMLSKDDEKDFNDYDYAHIPDLNRYYFINDIQVVGNNLFQLSLECDVLNTYRQSILECESEFKRNIKQGDYIDTTLDLSVLKSVELFKSGVMLGKDDTLILTTIGG